MTTGPQDKDDDDLVSGFTDPRLIHNYFEAPGSSAPTAPGAPGPGNWGYPPSGPAGGARWSRTSRTFIILVTSVVLAGLIAALAIYLAR